MCECYKIGGPFIAEDPDCPVHGRRAVALRNQGLSDEDVERLLREHGFIFGSDPIPPALINAMQAAGRLAVDNFLEQ